MYLATGQEVEEAYGRQVEVVELVCVAYVVDIAEGIVFEDDGGVVEDVLAVCVGTVGAEV